MQDIYSQAFDVSLKMFEEGRPQEEILSYLTKAAELAAGVDTVSSILLLDDKWSPPQRRVAGIAV